MIIQTNTIDISGKTQTYTVRKSNRARHILLNVNQQGEIELVVPRRASLLTAESFLKQRKVWLAGRIKHYETILAQSPLKQLVNGTKLRFLGQELELQIRQDINRKRPLVQRTASRITIIISANDQKNIKAALVQFYREAARNYFYKVVQRTVRDLKVKVACIKIGNYSSQWGSCSRTGRISLNWRLLLGPEEISYYVAVHEVAHLVQQNHSKIYWEVVKRFDPDYEQHRRWLRRHGHELVI